jgi:aspartate aminotransferase
MARKKTGKKSGYVKTAKRMKQIMPSATLQLAERARELSVSGKKVISFSLGEPDFKTPIHIRRAAAKAMDSGLTHYTPALGIPELREAVADHCWNANKIPVLSNNIMITPTKLGIYNSILATVDSGDEVIIPEPAWVTYRPCVQLAGGKPLSVDLLPENEFRLDPEDLAEAITKKTKMIILNSPCNPTGAVYRHSDIKGIAELAVDNDLLVLTDETYEKIIFSGKHHSIAAEPGMFERTITVSGCSKSYAMTGWRIGWTAAPKEIFSEIKKLQEHSITCATSFAQHGAVAALNGSQKCVSDMVAKFRERRDIVVPGLNRIKGIKCIKPVGTFYAFCSYDYEINSMDFASFLIDKACVAVTPGSGFGEAGEGYFRISFAASSKTLKAGLENIKKAVESNF